MDATPGMVAVEGIDVERAGGSGSRHPRTLRRELHRLRRTAIGLQQPASGKEVDGGFHPVAGQATQAHDVGWRHPTRRTALSECNSAKNLCGIGKLNGWFRHVYERPVDGAPRTNAGLQTFVWERPVGCHCNRPGRKPQSEPRRGLMRNSR